MFGGSPLSGYVPEGFAEKAVETRTPEGFEPSMGF